MAIDVGLPAIDRAGSYGSGNTCIQADNPANDNGMIDTVQIYAQADMGGVKVGLFYCTGGVWWVCRSAVTIGAVAAGFKSFHRLYLDVVAGDCIGIYYSSGNLELDDSGGDFKYFPSADKVIVGAAGNVSSWPYRMSVYGVGSPGSGGFRRSFCKGGLVCLGL